MSGTRKYYVFLAILVIASVLVKMAEPEEIDWSEGYSMTEKKPFGSFIFFNLLSKGYLTDAVKVGNYPIFELKNNIDSETDNIIFINEVFTADRFETPILLDIAKNGSHIFISANNFSDVFHDSLGFKTNAQNFVLGNIISGEDESKNVTLNLENADLRKMDGWNFKNIHQYSYISKFDTSKTTVLGRDSEQNTNFIKIEHGKGAVFVHTDPFIFGNYFMRDISTYDYALKVLSHLPKGNFYWDEYYKSGKSLYFSPMRYVVSNKSLKRVWFITLAGILLYLVFNGRRTHRIIPEPKNTANTSILFAKTIGSLYLKSSSHKDIASKKYRHLMEYIRTHWNIDTHNIDNAAIIQISKRSGVDEAIIADIFDKRNILNENEKINDRQLKEIADKIDSFYNIVHK